MRDEYPKRNIFEESLNLGSWRPTNSEKYLKMSRAEKAEMAAYQEPLRAEKVPGTLRLPLDSCL